MATTEVQTRVLGRVVIGFVLAAAVIIALQVLPATGHMLSAFFAPAWAGVLLHLLLICIAILALLGRVPRWTLAAPLVVWIGGAGYWWFECAAIRARMMQPPSPLALPTPADHLVFTKNLPIPLAQALVGLYEVKSAHVLDKRYYFATGADCERDTKVQSQIRVAWSPDFLKQRQQCVLTTRAPASAEGYDIVVHPVAADLKTYVIAEQPRDRVSEIDISVRGQPAAFNARVTVRQEYPPPPVFWPLAGCDYASGARRCFVGMMRSPFLAEGNPDHDLTNARWIHNDVFYLANALGLQRRPGVGR